MTGYGIDRFTANITITAPAGTVIVGSGSIKNRKRPTPSRQSSRILWRWPRPSFPRTIIAGPFVDQVYGSSNVHVYFSNAKKQFAPFYGDTAVEKQKFNTSVYGADRHADVEDR